MRSRSDRGSATVEFAVVLPAVALVLTVLVAAVVLVDRRGALQVAAATASRAAGRGDAAAAAAVIAGLGPGATASYRHADGMVCVDVQRRPGGPFAAVPLRATGCAAEDGR